jgi:hypothetical protein
MSSHVPRETKLPLATGKTTTVSIRRCQGALGSVTTLGDALSLSPSSIWLEIQRLNSLAPFPTLSGQNPSTKTPLNGRGKMARRVATTTGRCVCYLPHRRCKNPSMRKPKSIRWNPGSTRKPVQEKQTFSFPPDRHREQQERKNKTLTRKRKPTAKQETLTTPLEDETQSYCDRRSSTTRASSPYSHWRSNRPIKEVATNPNASASAPPFVFVFVSFVVATRARELRLRERVAKATS